MFFWKKFSKLISLSQAKKIFVVSLFFLLYFVVCEMIVRYESLGMIALSYEKTKTVVPMINTRYLFDIRDLNTCFNVNGLVPNASGYFKGTRIQTNSLGMRDREYTLKKPNGVFRIVNVGPSTTFGSGVPIEKVYHSILENMLNQDGDKMGYEILSWSMGWTSTRCLLEQMKLTPAYSPDMVFLTTRFELLNNDDIRSIVKFHEETGISVLLFSFNSDLPESMKKIGGDKILILNLDIPYGSEDYIYPSDFHPNARVHALYAQALYKFFSDHKKEIFNQSHPKSITVELPKVDPIPNSRYKNGFFESYYAEKISQKFKKIAVWK